MRYEIYLMRYFKFGILQPYMKNLPPKWYTKLERFIAFNWLHIFMMALFASFLYMAFTSTDNYGEAEYERTSR